jgi:transketolase C-terminal domain/subunit
MTVPGQISDSEFADTPQNLGRIGANSRSGVFREPLPRFTGALGDAWHNVVELVGEAFHPGKDRIVCETRGAGAATPGRLEQASEGSVKLPSGWIAAPPGEGLALGLGLVVARRCFNQHHWIVVVASVDGLLRALSHSTIELLQANGSHLLVVAVDDGLRSSSVPGDDPRWNGQFDSLDARWLTDIGMQSGEPVDAENAPALAGRLREIRDTGRSHLLQVRFHPTFQSELPVESRSRGMLRLPERTTGPADSFPLIVDEIGRLSEKDAGLVIVTCSSLHSRWQHSSARRDGRLQLTDAGDSIVTRARGAALGGCRPVMLFDEETFPRHLNGVRNEICAPARSATILLLESAPGGPIASGSTDSSSRLARGPSPLAYLRLLPQTSILVPSDQQELRAMLRWSHAADGPVAIFVPRVLTSDPRRDESTTVIESGRAELLADGIDVAIFALGPHLEAARDASLVLSRQGLSAAVVNARFAHPVDVEILERLARKVRGIVTVEPDGLHGGFGTTVLERMAARGQSIPVVATRSSAAAREGGRLARKAIAERIVDAALDVVERFGTSSRAEARRPRLPLSRRRSEVEREFLLAPDKLKAERDLVQNVELSPAIDRWHSLYSQTGHRSDYLWRWCLHGVRITSLPSVAPEHFAHVCDTKLASIILCVLFDDVADEHGSERLLTEMLRVTRDDARANLSGLDSAERLHVEITEEIWRDYMERAQSYPYADVYTDLLRYDLMQFFNTMCYSQLLNSRPSLLNLTEHDLYTSHNMQMISFSTLDLMCSHGFSVNELGKLREAMWHAQCMGRIGNLLSTWQREIVNRDFTSGVFARAVSRGDLTLDQLTEGDADTVESAILSGAHDQYFFRRWLQHREHLRFRATQIQSVDLRPVLVGHDRFLLMHLGCRGLI